MNNTTIYQQFQASEPDTWIAATLMGFLNTAAMITNMFLLFLVFKIRGQSTLENSFIANFVAFDLVCTVTFIGIVIYWYLYLTTPQRIAACFLYDDPSHLYNNWTVCITLGYGSR